MKIAVMPGSLRTGSWNKKFAHVVEKMLQDSGHEVHFCDLKSFHIPVYDGDIEDSQGIPAGVTELDQIIKSCAALIVVTPEYNGSIPGILKNTVDWLSRIKPHCFQDRQILLLGASPGPLGAIRSLWHTRQPFAVLEAHVYPKVYGLAKAHQAFHEQGGLLDAATEQKVSELVHGFIAYIGSVHHASTQFQDGAVEMG
jgi:NAD(P)H-dependent FMN reductase